MVDRKVNIASRFPRGLRMEQFHAELEDLNFTPDPEWQLTSDGHPRRVQTTGQLKVETNRDLTNPEFAAAVAVMNAHDPSNFERPGLLLKHLPQVRESAGSVFFVRNVAKTGGGNGTMVYSDGRRWRRISDDEAVD